MEKCLKRKYKKPLLNECFKKNLNVTESMSIAELCSILHSQKKEPNKKKQEKKKMIKKDNKKAKSQQDKHVQFIHDNFLKKDQFLSSKVHFINLNFSKAL